MSEHAKITPSHLSRLAVVYLRQSSAAQVEHNRESTDRQYALAAKARDLGWPDDRIIVIDEDLGLSGSGAVARSGFARLTAEVALAHVGLVLGLEVSRLARNNAEWYRLIDLAGLTDTLIGDADGIYHPALFNDRLLLGLKGTMSEAELHVLRARLNGGIRNKAARGELRRGLPVGFVWGDADGEVRFHPDEAVVTAIRTIFARFAEMGSVRRVWLWLRAEGLKVPLQDEHPRGSPLGRPELHRHPPCAGQPRLPAPTSMAERARRRSSMPRACAGSVYEGYRAPNGRW
jgi:DNA invertase Pin-like site-specific DNA recombinase